VIEEHLEEHGFLHLQRRKLIFSTDFPLRRLAAHDERIAAHWDGLSVGADASIELALRKLEAEDPWEIASAALAWLMLAKPAAPVVAERLAATPPERAASWREAFRQCPADVALAALPAKGIASLPPHALGVAIDAHAWHERLDREQATQLARHADPAVRAVLARALPHSGLGDEGPSLLKPLLDDEAPIVRHRALWSAALLAPEDALARSRRAAGGGSPDAFALSLLGLLGEPDDHAAIVAAAGTDAGRIPALWAFSALGTEESVESLIRLLSLPDEELVAAVADALEAAIGSIPRETRDAPPTIDDARKHWADVSGSLPRGAPVMAGHARPWRGEKSEEPMRWLWRSGIGRPRSAAPWLRREVPDGFFDGVPSFASRPGE
jgi:uncharacterized protein (TIGR02270 family)